MLMFHEVLRNVRKHAPIQLNAPEDFGTSANTLRYSSTPQEDLGTSANTLRYSSTPQKTSERPQTRSDTAQRPIRFRNVRKHAPIQLNAPRRLRKVRKHAPIQLNVPEDFYTRALFRSTFSYKIFRHICRRLVYTAVLGLGGGDDLRKCAKSSPSCTHSDETCC